MDTTVVKYDKATFDLLSELSNINNKVYLQKDGQGNITINSVDTSNSMFYSFSAPEDKFDFDGSECYLANYKEFYGAMGIFGDAKIEQTGSDLLISENKQKITYRLTAAERAENEFEGVDFDPQIEFKLTSTDIKNINDMINRFVTNDNGSVQLEINEGELTLTISSFNHENTYSEKYDGVKNENSEEVDMKLSTNIFTILPFGDYFVEIDPVGLVRFSLIGSSASVKIYTGEQVIED